MATRSPICVLLAHVDHGKTSILDKIRGTAVAKGEAGGITQAIGASIIPLSTIKGVCGELLKTLKMQFTIPGILFVDSPGHEAFTTLRKRGGSLADIAIVVIDINEGFKPQTIEVIEILKHYKTPFVVAANKIDLISGWQVKEGSLLQKINSQAEQIKQILDRRLYEIVGKLSEYGFNSERFDRVEDYTKQVAIIPTSAKTGDGIPELLMVLTGLAQKYLEQSLKCDVSGAAKGTVMEVKEQKGLGCCLDVIIYDGTLKVNDVIVIGGIDKPVVTKVRGLFEPVPLAEMREKKSKFTPVKTVTAATGVRISAPEIENVIAGMPIRAAGDDLEEVKEEVQREVEEVLIETDKEGIVIKADTLGSLEALVKLLRDKNIMIRNASVGNVTKKDVVDAESNYEKDLLRSVILGFNVAVNEDAHSEKVKILTNAVIYKLIEDFERWQKEEKKAIEAKELDLLVRPCKLELMRGYVFRQSNPAICGVDVIEGVLKTGIQLMKDGKVVGTVKEIQQEKENLSSVEKGKQVAISIDGATIGRHINEGDTLYPVMPESDFRKIKKLRRYLSKGEVGVLKEIAAIMRKEKVVWGI